LGNPRGLKAYELYKEIRKRVIAESPSIPNNPENARKL